MMDKLFIYTPHLKQLCVKKAEYYIDNKFSLSHLRKIYKESDDSFERIGISLAIIQLYPNDVLGYIFMFDSCGKFDFSFFPSKYYVLEYYIDFIGYNGEIIKRLLERLFEENSFGECLFLLSQFKLEIKNDNKTNFDIIKKICIKILDIESFDYFFPNDDFPNLEQISSVNLIFEVLGDKFDMHNDCIRRNLSSIERTKLVKVMILRSFMLGNRSLQFFELGITYFQKSNDSNDKKFLILFMEQLFIVHGVTKFVKKLICENLHCGRYDKACYLFMLYKQGNHNESNMMYIENIMRVMGCFSRITRDIYPVIYEMYLLKNGCTICDNLYHSYNTIQYNTIQYNTIQYNTIQYNTIQYNTIQYNTIIVTV